MNADKDPWPSIWPPVGVELSDEQKIAACARIIAKAGMALDIAGHITQTRPDGTMWSTPHGKFWREMNSSDVLVVDDNGKVLEGRWDVTKAIFIHTEIHRLRPDAKVIIHNHPYYATLLATLERTPEITDQQAIIFDGDVMLFNEFTGGIDDASSGTYLAEALGDANVVMLANHGLLVFAETVEEAAYRYVTFERTCKLNYDAWVTGQKPTTVPEQIRKSMKPAMLAHNHIFYWKGAVRELLEVDTEVLR